MEVSTLLKQFNDWKSTAHTSRISNNHAESQFEHIKVQEILIDGYSMIKKSQQLQKEIQETQTELKELQISWKKLQSKTTINTKLKSGETHILNLNQHPKLQDLWQQGSKVFTNNDSETASQPETPIENINLDLPIPISQPASYPTSRETLYSPQHLSEESDELLTHLT